MDGSGLNWKFIIKIIGFILIFESFFMFATAGVGEYFKDGDADAFLISGGITLICGLLIVLTCGFKQKTRFFTKRESYLSVTLSWVFFAAFGALPFYISGFIPSITDAFFESMSGISSTGASIIRDIESTPHGLLFWRSLLQWLGGMGIIVFSLALLPLLGGEAAQLFDAETPGMTHDKFRPRITQMAKRLWAIYLSLTALLIVLLSLGPMNVFDAVCHGFSTISTGGFSTKQDSIAFWNSAYTETVIMVFMVIGALNFPLLYFLFKGQFKKFFQDEELQWFIGIILIATLMVGAGLFIEKNYAYTTSIRAALFHVISVLTTTGYTTEDYTTWGSFFLVIFLFLMIVCGCSGSTSGGLKIVRVVVLVKNTFCEFERLIHPRAIIPVRLNNTALSFGVAQRLLAFFVLYVGIIIINWGILTMAGIPYSNALGVAVSAIGNAGAGFGEFGSFGSYADISGFTKWYLAFLMIVGRLEIFTILILFTPGFWKK